LFPDVASIGDFVLEGELGGKMMGVDVDALIRKSVSERIKEKGLAVPELTAETRMLGGELPLDSLDLATILIEMQAELGHDPFAEGFVEFRTIGELATLYRKSLG
jgi:acyl carrier protein